MKYMLEVLQHDAFQELKAIIISLEHRAVIDRDLDHLDILDGLLDTIYCEAAQCDEDAEVSKVIADVEGLLKHLKEQLIPADEDEINAASNEINKVYH